MAKANGKAQSAYARFDKLRNILAVFRGRVVTPQELRTRGQENGSWSDEWGWVSEVSAMNPLHLSVII
jgi:hypothetical protein